jgi:hypothetical protein
VNPSPSAPDNIDINGVSNLDGSTPYTPVVNQPFLLRVQAICNSGHQINVTSAAALLPPPAPQTTFTLLGPFHPTDIGHPITDFPIGSNIPPGTSIVSVVDNVSATINNAVTSSLPSFTISIGDAPTGCVTGTQDGNNFDTIAMSSSDLTATFVPLLIKVPNTPGAPSALTGGARWYMVTVHQAGIVSIRATDTSNTSVTANLPTDYWHPGNCLTPLQGVGSTGGCTIILNFNPFAPPFSEDLHLRIDVPTNAVAGVPFNFTVSVRDTGNNLVPLCNIDHIHFTTNSENANLPGDSLITLGSFTGSATLTNTGNIGVLIQDASGFFFQPPTPQCPYEFTDFEYQSAGINVAQAPVNPAGTVTGPGTGTAAGQPAPAATAVTAAPAFTG